MGNCCSRLTALLFPSNVDRSSYTPIDNTTTNGSSFGASSGSYQFSSGQISHQPFSDTSKNHKQNNGPIPIPSSNSSSSSSGGGLEMNAFGGAHQSNSSAFHLNFELREEIGVGSTSKCYKCIRKGSGQEFACKVIDKRNVQMKFSGLLDQFFLEVKVLKFLNHPNIIHLEETYETIDRIYMVLEMMKGGELFDYVVNKGTLSEEEAASLVRQITSAVAHMHGQDVIHRDLKPENLLLTTTTPGALPQVKLIDFGLAKVLQEEVANSFLGTKGYLAPEMLQRLSYDKAVDMWAVGVIVFVLLCGCLPFDDDSTKISSESVARQKFTLRFPKWASNLSASAKDLLHNLLEVNPKTRYTAAQALNHPWVSGKTVQQNNYLQSPSVMGARREQLRSPKVQHFSSSARTTARAGAAATADIMYSPLPIRVYGGPIPAFKEQAGNKNGGPNKQQHSQQQQQPQQKQQTHAASRDRKNSI